MKRFLAIAALVLLASIGSAQDYEGYSKKLASIKKKELELKFLGQEPAMDRKQFKKPELSVRNQQKPAVASTTVQPDQNHRYTMPVVAPDSTIIFPILSARTDSAILYHMQVRRPE